MSFSFNASSDKPKIPAIDPGLYPSRVVGVVSLGIQKFTDLNGLEQVKQKVAFIWELPTEVIEVEDSGEIVSKPRWLAKEFVFSTHSKSALVPVLLGLGWSAKLNSKTNYYSGGQNADYFVGKPCMLNVGLTSGGNNKVVGVTKVPKGIEVAALVNEPFCFDFNNPDVEVFNRLPKWIQKRIQGAVNYNADKFNVGELEF